MLKSVKDREVKGDRERAGLTRERKCEAAGRAKEKVQSEERACKKKSTSNLANLFLTYTTTLK